MGRYITVANWPVIDPVVSFFLLLILHLFPSFLVSSVEEKEKEAEPEAEAEVGGEEEEEEE